MGFLKKIKALLGKPSGTDALYVYAACDRCGTPVKVRIDLLRDPVSTFEDSGAQFELHKDVMDSKCFAMMRLHMTFGRGKKELSRELEGGEFITGEEYGVRTGSQAR